MLITIMYLIYIKFRQFRLKCYLEQYICSAMPILKAETCNNYHNYLSLLKGQKYHNDEYIYLKGRCRGRRKNVQLNFCDTATIT
jgi:hypothetical protein